MIASSANTKLNASAPRRRPLPAGRSSKARSWLALRAIVLRRAVCPPGTAQERRAEVNAGAVSQCSRGAKITRIGPTLGVRGSRPISRIKPIAWQQACQPVRSGKTTERPLGNHVLCLHIKVACALRILQVKLPSAAKLTTFNNFSAG